MTRNEARRGLACAQKAVFKPEIHVRHLNLDVRKKRGAPAQRGRRETPRGPK